MEIEENLEYVIPRELRNPISESGSVLQTVDDIFCKIVGQNEGYFFDNFLGDLFNDETTSGDLAIEQMYEDSNEVKDGEVFLGILYVLFVASAYAVQAMKTYQQKTPESERLAWTFATDARYWIGIAMGDQAQREDQNSCKNKISEKAAAIRHTENRAIK